MARSRVKRFLPRPLLVAARRRRRQHRLLLALVALRHARLQQRAAERDHLRLRIDAELGGGARVERDREAVRVPCGELWSAMSADTAPGHS